MQFSAEVLEVRVKKAASLDKTIRIVMETNEETALELQKYVAQEVVRVEVTNAK